MATTLLSKAESSLRLAKVASNTGDEADLVWAQYHTEQAVVMMLKFVLGYMGLQLPEICNIPGLALAIPESQMLVPKYVLTELVDERGVALTTWKDSLDCEAHEPSGRDAILANVAFAEMLLQRIAEVCGIIIDSEWEE